MHKILGKTTKPSARAPTDGAVDTPVRRVVRESPAPKALPWGVAAMWRAIGTHNSLSLSVVLDLSIANALIVLELTIQSIGGILYVGFGYSKGRLKFE